MDMRPWMPEYCKHAGERLLWNYKQAQVTPTAAGQNRGSEATVDHGEHEQGVMMMPSKAVPQGAEGQALYKRLWVHESMRVFHDRLVDTPDRSWLLTQVIPLQESVHMPRFLLKLKHAEVGRLCSSPGSSVGFCKAVA